MKKEKNITHTKEAQELLHGSVFYSKQKTDFRFYFSAVFAGFGLISRETDTNASVRINDWVFFLFGQDKKHGHN